MHKRNVKSHYCLVGMLLIVGILLLGSAMGGCKGTTIPTEPMADPTPDPDNPTPVPTETPVIPAGEGTPTPGPTSYDGYADTPDDPTIETLETDEEAYTVTLEYTGDIDWYKIAVPDDTEVLSVALTDIPEEGDFDLVAYDAELVEFAFGRSTQAGNASEFLKIEDPGTLVYLQIYSYSGRGTALLTLTTEKTGEPPIEPTAEPTAEPTPEPTVEPTIDHLTYEEILSTYYPFYPRGDFSGLLERNVETVTVEQITCQGDTETLDGTLTIGLYAHVERNVLTLTDYIDGWALAVFDGPIQNLDSMTITIQVSIATDRDVLKLEVPADMQIRGERLSKFHSEEDVYYIVESYGDLWDSNSDDIRLSSGVIGDFGTFWSGDIFTQEVTLDWELTLPDDTQCSGNAEGTPIDDFEAASMFLSPMKYLDRIW
jgi:hypothetical protein